MERSWFLILLLLLPAVIAGCLGGGDDDNNDRSSSTPLEIEDIVVQDITSSSFTITWNTTVAADSSLEWWELDQSSAVTEPSVRGTAHVITVDELDFNTEYTFRVRAADGGPEVVSDIQVLTTDGGAIDITGVGATPSSDSVTITWGTTVAMDSRLAVWIPFQDPTWINDTAETMTHVVTMDNLTGATDYRYRVESERNGVLVASANLTFTTLPTPGAILVQWEEGYPNYLISFDGAVVLSEVYVIVEDTTVSMMENVSGAALSDMGNNTVLANNTVHPIAGNTIEVRAYQNDLLSTSRTIDIVPTPRASGTFVADFDSETVADYESRDNSIVGTLWENTTTTATYSGTDLDIISDGIQEAEYSGDIQIQSGGYDATIQIDEGYYRNLGTFENHSFQDGVEVSNDTHLVDLANYVFHADGSFIVSGVPVLGTVNADYTADRNYEEMSYTNGWRYLERNDLLVVATPTNIPSFACTNHNAPVYGNTTVETLSIEDRANETGTILDSIVIELEVINETENGCLQDFRGHTIDTTWNARDEVNWTDVDYYWEHAEEDPDSGAWTNSSGNNSGHPSPNTDPENDPRTLTYLRPAENIIGDRIEYVNDDGNDVLVSVLELVSHTVGSLTYDTYHINASIYEDGNLVGHVDTFLITNHLFYNDLVLEEFLYIEYEGTLAIDEGTFRADVHTWLTQVS